jgi:hypothetical protein
MTAVPGRLRALVGVLLVVCAALVIIGVSLEGEEAESAAETPLPLIGLAVLSIVLAVWVWRWPSRVAVGAVIVVTTGAGVFDVVEVGRQLSADRAGLAVLAVVIVALRVVTLAAAAGCIRYLGTGLPSKP